MRGAYLTFVPGAHITARRAFRKAARRLPGVGCHFMATHIFPGTKIFSPMGTEGAAWVGHAPFTDTPDIFANMGDGTYCHSGLLAIRAAVAANTSITFKILYNDATAATGGQPLPTPLDVPGITAEKRRRRKRGKFADPPRRSFINTRVCEGRLHKKS